MKIVRDSHPVLFFSQKETESIIAAIRKAEMRTSGEIRVHLERKAREPFLEHGKAIFQKLGMTRTRDRNGVLIFMGLASRRFAVLGDTGIHAKVQESFWTDIASILEREFKEDRFADGIIQAVERIGERLREHFPYQRSDTNELPDEISYSI